MNKQISKLIKQHGVDITIDGMGYGEGNIEGLAELIVRECANIAREWSDDYVVEDTAPKQVDMFIKQHFGVEE